MSAGRPCGPMGKSPPADAGDMGLIPGPGGLTGCGATAEPEGHSYWSQHGLEPAPCSRTSHRRGKPAGSKEEKPPLTAAGEKPALQWRSNTAINT